MKDTKEKKTKEYLLDEQLKDRHQDYMVAKCPECGKENPTMDIGRWGEPTERVRKTHFCDHVCESNYRYRMSHMDIRDGFIIDPEETLKL